MAITEFFAGIPVADYEMARAWYERVMGKTASFYPQDGEAVWQVMEHGWIYVVRDAERAGKALITILVDDLEAVAAGLIQRGLEPVRTDIRAILTDPEGNRVTFAQP